MKNIQHERNNNSSRSAYQPGVVCPVEDCQQLIPHADGRLLADGETFETCCPGCGVTFAYDDSYVLEGILPPSGVDGEGAAPSERDGDAATAASLYLETKRIVVDGASVGFEVCPRRCKANFCPHCCRSQGLGLREKLTRVVSGWRAVMMVTLTVDPRLFDNPRQAHDHVQKERKSISELVRVLRRRKLLLGKHYFCVVEWQRDTEMAHYHLLLEAEFIPFDLLCEIWNRNRPENAGPVVGVRPGFGSVRFSAPRFTNNEHAARYATKYLIKHPDHGYPDWVMDCERPLKRFSPSQGLWKSADSDDGDRDSKNKPKEKHGKKKPRQPRTIRERVNNCCKEAVILKVLPNTDEQGNESSQRIFFTNCFGSYADIKKQLGFPDELPPIRIPIDRTMAFKLGGISAGDHFS